MEQVPYIEDSLIKNCYYGHIIPSTLPKGAVSDIRLPEVPEGITIVSEPNLPGVKGIKINDAEVPILGGEEIFFAGQPVVFT